MNTENLETESTYKIGKTIVSINRIFRTENAETLDKIILNLMKKDSEKS